VQRKLWNHWVAETVGSTCVLHVQRVLRLLLTAYVIPGGVCRQSYKRGRCCFLVGSLVKYLSPSVLRVRKNLNKGWQRLDIVNRCNNCLLVGKVMIGGVG
jgi:hypothetical protein